MPDGESDYAAVCDDNSIPPIIVTADDAAELVPCWNAIAGALAGLVGFTHAQWQDEGCVRRIGSTHNSRGTVTPVLLFLPSGRLGDGFMLMECLAARSSSLVLLPSMLWMSSGIDALRTKIGHEFIAVAERLASPAMPSELPVMAADRRATTAVKAVIRPAAGMEWKDITVTIITGRTLRITAPGQQHDHTFRSRSKLSHLHPLGILMKLAANSQWTNPPKHDDNYEKTVKAFGRMRQLIHDLVPLPADPFVRSAGAWVPTFNLAVSESLKAGMRVVTSGQRR